MDADMNWTIIIIETIILTAAFTAMILIPLVKNPVWWIADYPEDIQEEYFKTHERISAAARRDLYLNWDDVVRDVYEDYCTFVEMKR